MAWHPSIHPEFVQALRVLDAIGMPYAEALRLLKPVAMRLGVPRPSSASVRRILIAERRRKWERLEYLERILTDIYHDRPPRLWEP